MQIKEDEMGGHVTHMGRKGMRAEFWWGNVNPYPVNVENKVSS